MVAGARLVEDSTKKLYWFEVPNDVNPFIAPFFGDDLLYKYVLVDTCNGPKIAELCLLRDEAPTGIKVTRKVITTLEKDDIEHFLNNKSLAETNRELQNKIANIYSILAAQDSHGYRITELEKLTALVGIAAVCDDENFKKRVKEITDLWKKRKEILTATISE